MLELYRNYWLHRFRFSYIPFRVFRIVLGNISVLCVLWKASLYILLRIYHFWQLLTSFIHASFSFTKFIPNLCKYIVNWIEMLLFVFSFYSAIPLPQRHQHPSDYTHCFHIERSRMALCLKEALHLPCWLQALWESIIALYFKFVILKRHF